jgi:hypothetical protein
MDAHSKSADKPCQSCGVIGPPHGSDSDCVAALRTKVDQLNAFVESLVKQSARRRDRAPGVAERRSRETPVSI